MELMKEQNDLSHLAEEVFPICCSITEPDIRERLHTILNTFH